MSRASRAELRLRLHEVRRQLADGRLVVHADWPALVELVEQLIDDVDALEARITAHHPESSP